MQRKLSLVVPCHNEAENLRELHAQTLGAFDSLGSFSTLELVLVDDGSTDRTMAVARQLAEADSRVRVVSFSRNFGKEAAMLAGLRAARGDAVVIMDADLQHPPELIPDLVKAHEEGNHQVVAVRDRKGDPWLRTQLSRAFYRVVGRLMDVQLQDGAGDFRLLSRKAVDAVLSLTEVNRFSKGLFAWVGMKTATVTYANQPRAGGQSSWGTGSLVNYGISGILAFNDKLVRMSVKLGMLALAVSLAYVVFLVVNAILSGIEAPGYITTIAAIVGMGGLQLVFLGVLGEYVGKIYAEVKRRPAYILEEELNADS